MRIFIVFALINRKNKSFSQETENYFLKRRVQSRVKESQRFFFARKGCKREIGITCWEPPPRRTVIKADGHLGGQAGGQKFGLRSWPAKSKTDEDICDQTITAKKISLRKMPNIF
ncbi:hypothetical protein BpHYR1_053933 [Brachionus plicatilis]|uniref:Uncharacterized protein n=1 Tax=Brachionus plicatilis TaxID=10195 RepID=A0A3M7QB48_BRAPC|nr:hypothetical protein BpHYR1_053933 [Brachionus plicatilis]